MLTRVVLVIVALGLAVWLGASLQSLRLEDQGKAVVSGGEPAGSQALALLMRGSTPENLRRSARLLRRAREWAPLQASATGEAAVVYSSGDRRGALRLLDDVLSREPENTEAWAMMAIAAQRLDPPRARLARRRLAELKPPVPMR